MAFGLTVGINEVRRAALFTEDMQLIEHYVFPAISGGKVMTVACRCSNKPDGTPGKLIGTVTLSGDTTADDSDASLTPLLSLVMLTTACP